MDASCIERSCPRKTHNRTAPTRRRLVPRPVVWRPPIRGVLFENAVVVKNSEAPIQSRASVQPVSFLDVRGLECDLLYESANDLSAFEIKSGATIASDYFDSLNQVAKVLPQISTKTVVYAGSDRQSRRYGEAVLLTDLRETLIRPDEEAFV